MKCKANGGKKKKAVCSTLDDLWYVVRMQAVLS